MNAYEEYWLSLILIIVSSFGFGLVLGINVMGRKAISIINERSADNASKPEASDA